jgi:hypothetical protein
MFPLETRVETFAEKLPGNYMETYGNLQWVNMLNINNKTIKHVGNFLRLPQNVSTPPMRGVETGNRNHF